MSFQNWTTFVNQMTHAIQGVVSFDAFFAYDICHLAYSDHYYSNLNPHAIDEYLLNYQQYDPLCFKHPLSQSALTEGMMVLKQHIVPESYQGFIDQQKIQDNIELWFHDDAGMTIKGLSLVRLSSQNQFTENEIKIIKGYHTFAKYHFASHLSALLSPQQQPQISSQLTKKEQQIMSLMMQGQKNQKIADEMFISIHTVKTHVQHILQKMQVDSRQELMSKVLHYG